MYKQFNNIDDLLNFITNAFDEAEQINNSSSTPERKRFLFQEETVIDLPYLDKSKLKAVVESPYLIVTYQNENDKRRQSFSFSIPIVHRGVKHSPQVSYEDGYLKINMIRPKESKIEVPIN